MISRLRISLVALLVVGALSVAMAGTALAQDETPTPKPYFGRGFSRGLGSEAGLEAAAGVLGMTVEDLSNQLWAGTTLADLATDAGIDLQVVRDAVVAAQEAAHRDSIEQAVADGIITRENADWLLEGLDNGYLGGHGFGGHGRHGGMRGFGRFGGFGHFEAPATPSDSTGL